MTPILLGVDIGTTGLKAVAVGEDGRMLADHAVRYRTSVDGEAAEQDAMDWWDALCAAASTVVAGRPVLASRKAAVAPAPGRVFSLETGHQLSGLVASSRAPRSMHSWALCNFSRVVAPSPTTT